MPPSWNTKKNTLFLLCVCVVSNFVWRKSDTETRFRHTITRLPPTCQRLFNFWSLFAMKRVVEKYKHKYWYITFNHFFSTTYVNSFVTQSSNYFLIEPDTIHQGSSIPIIWKNMSIPYLNFCLFYYLLVQCVLFRRQLVFDEKWNSSAEYVYTSHLVSVAKKKAKPLRYPKHIKLHMRVNCFCGLYFLTLKKNNSHMKIMYTHLDLFTFLMICKSILPNREQRYKVDFPIWKPDLCIYINIYFFVCF